VKGRNLPGAALPLHPLRGGEEPWDALSLMSDALTCGSYACFVLAQRATHETRGLVRCLRNSPW
jgi:hypothetical protein